jgi:hypothetical protein
MNFYIYPKYLFQMTKKVKQKILYFLPVLIAGIFIAMALAPVTSGGSSQIQPTTTTATEVNQTMPYLNTNITWSQFNESMLPNEYLNGTDQPQYLNAEPSTYYKNYISINPADIRTNRPYPSYATPSNATVTGTTTTASETFTHSGNDIFYNITANATKSPNAGIEWNFPFSSLPSANLNYDYVTILYRVSGASIVGEQARIDINDLKGANAIMSIDNGTGGGIISFSLGQAYDKVHTLNETYYGTYGVSPLVGLDTPTTLSPETVDFEVTGLYVTTYPISMGSNAYGSTVSNAFGTIQLADFHPDINNVSIVDNGYTEALSQPMSMGLNYTYTQAQLTGSEYIEENTREANLEFPTGSDISYSNSNISLVLNGVAGDQIGIYNINGVSYSSSVSTMQGNQTLYTGSVNPNQPNNVIIQTEYTAEQWNSITQAPFFLSVQGIEYYWWIFLIGTFGAIGIFAGLKSYSEGKEENLRAPPKVR